MFDGIKFLKIVRYLKKNYSTAIFQTPPCAESSSLAATWSVWDLKFSLRSPISISGPKYSLKQLWFPEWGCNHDNDWANHPERLERVIAAISRSSLRESFTFLSVHFCNVTEEKAQKMLWKYGMDNVDVLEDY